MFVLPPPLAEPAALLPVDLAAVDVTHLLRVLDQPPTPLLVDCSALPCQRTLGICFLISQLLVLREGGSRVWLRNASPTLRHCLGKLQLGPLFNLID